MKYIKTKEENSILYITLARPVALNALNPEMIVEIGDALRGSEHNSDVVGAIITGEGEKAFAAGADIKGFPALNEEEGRNISIQGHHVFDYVESYPKPVIAVVNGYALGGGCELAMACHIRIAKDNAVFGMPETKLGLIPGYGGTQRLAALIGKAKALEYILTADMIDAGTALRLGLVNHVELQENAMSTAEKIISKIAQRGPKAVESAIDCINAFYEKDANGYELVIQKFGELMASSEAKEGVLAFLDKRKPNFKR